MIVFFRRGASNFWNSPSELLVGCVVYFVYGFDNACPGGGGIRMGGSETPKPVLVASGDHFVRLLYCLLRKGDHFEVQFYQFHSVVVTSS